MTHGELAAQYFARGYACSQAVLLAFSDLTGLDESTALRISSSFGGGMGRLREVCGAVSGMFMAAGLLFSGDMLNAKDKKEHYARIQELAARFRAANGSIVCRELLNGVPAKPGAEPEPRTAEYYKKRPCSEYCRIAADILEQYLLENPR